MTFPFQVIVFTEFWPVGGCIHAGSATDRHNVRFGRLRAPGSFTLRLAGTPAVSVAAARSEATRKRGPLGLCHPSGQQAAAGTAVHQLEAVPELKSYIFKATFRDCR